MDLRVNNLFLNRSCTRNVNHYWCAQDLGDIFCQLPAEIQVYVIHDITTFNCPERRFQRHMYV